MRIIHLPQYHLAILGYLQETTVHLPHWAQYQDALTQLALALSIIAVKRGLTFEADCFCGSGYSCDKRYNE